MSYRNKLLPIVVFVLAAAGAARASHTVTPVALTQQNSDLSSLCTGCTTKTTQVALSASSDAATCGGTMYLEFEVRTTGQSFVGTPTHTSASMYKASCVQQAYSPTTITLPAGTYKWQVREASAGMTPSTWALYGGGVTAFVVGGGSQISVSPSSWDYGNQNIGTSSAAQTYNINSTGMKALVVSSISLGGANPSDFKIMNAPGLPTSVAVGNFISVDVVFAPTGPGLRTANLVIGSDASNGSTTTIALQGTGRGAQFSATPNPVTFGSVNVGGTSTLSLTVRNTGDLNLTVASATVSGTNAAEFSVTAATPFTLTPGNSSQLPITFKPTAIGSRTARISFASNDPLNPIVDVNVSGTGTAPVMSVSPGSLNFGKVRVNTTSSINVTVTNSGNGALTLKTIGLSGAGAAQFSLGSLTAPITVAAGAQRVIAVLYAPTMVGMATAQLDLTSDDPNKPTATVSLAGEGTSPMIAIAPAKLDFGNQLVGRAATARKVTVSNNGSAALRITNITFNGAAGPEYTVDGGGSFPVTIQPGQQYDVGVTLKAAMMGMRDATMGIESDDPKMALVSVMLTGVGVSSVMSVTPPMIDYGPVKLGGMPVARMVTIENTGADPITLGNAVVGGMTPMGFTVGAAAATLMPNEKKMVAVTFMPPTAGEYSATVTFASTDTTLPAAEVKVLGRAASMLLSVMPTMLNFTNVVVTYKSKPQTLTLTNVSGGPLQLEKVESTESSFVIAGVDTSKPIPAGGTVELAVTLEPKVVGMKMGTIDITLAGGNPPELMVPVSGRAIQLSSSSGGCSVATGAAAGAGSGALVLAALAAFALLLRRRRA